MKAKVLCLSFFIIASLCSCTSKPELLRTSEVQQSADPWVSGEMEKIEQWDLNQDRKIDPNAIQIGVSLQGTQRPFIERLEKRLLELEKTYDGKVQLTILDGQEEPERQNVQIEEFVVQKVDVIIFNSISYDEGALGVELARKNEIPIVLLTTYVRNYKDAQALAVSNHEESAHLQMDLVADYLDYSGNIAIIKGPSSIESSFKRTKGYMEKLDEYPGLQVVAEQPANWSPEEAYAIVENWIRLGIDIDAIVAQNDIMAIGALQAVEEGGMQEKIAVFGIDGDIEALELIKEGRMAGTVYHDAIAQADLAMEYAISLAQGLAVDSRIVPYQTVDRNNVNWYVDNYYKFYSKEGNNG